MSRKLFCFKFISVVFVLIIIILFVTPSPVMFATERGDLDEETQPVGLEHFIIKEIPLNGVTSSVKLIDLNHDGIKEIIYLYEAVTSPTATSNGTNEETISQILRQDSLYLHILFFDRSINEYRSKQIIKVPAGAGIISIGNYTVAIGKEIAFYTTSGIFCYQRFGPSGQQGEVQGSPARGENDDIYAETPVQLIQDPTIFHAVERYYPNPILQEGEDINNDGTDDFIIPTRAGYLICRGPYQNGTPAKKQIIEQPPSQSIKTTRDTFVTIASYFPNISLIDLNGDKAKDIILGFNDRLSYYFQNKMNSSFPAEPSGEFRLDFLTPPDNKNGSNVLLYSNQFCDINADGVMDLVIASTSGDLSDIGNLVTRIFIFIADSSQPAKIYPDNPAQVINIKGICPLWHITEINGDAYPDLFITWFKVTMGSNIKKAILRYIPITYQISLNRPTKLFSVAPDYERIINFPVNAITKGAGYFSHIYFGYDFNNDSRTDLLTISGPEKNKGVLVIYAGRPKERLTRPDGVSFEKDEFLLYPCRIPDKVIVSDLSDDGKNDIILQYKSRLITLIKTK
ncbi:MAG: VCBS repeat-containing protein [Planctomycetota bacterium]